MATQWPFWGCQSVFGLCGDPFVSLPVSVDEEEEKKKALEAIGGHWRPPRSMNMKINYLMDFFYQTPGGKKGRKGRKEGRGSIKWDSRVQRDSGMFLTIINIIMIIMLWVFLT